jgi:cell division protein FtsA
MKEDVLFALDIGTRKVMGLVYERLDEGFRILGHSIMEHPNRSMRDGQIHHVSEVASVIKSVKNELEDMIGVQLTNVAVAAAGRSLRTAIGEATCSLDLTQPVTDYICQIAKLTAVQDAEDKLVKANTGEGQVRTASFYCVGYTVQQWLLDGMDVGEPRGQRGEVLSVKVIATFLPVVVIDSLIKALEESDLVLRSITLEPIAAMNVVVPRDMRTLNLVLVDIGAGTSDIAITADGMIKAYGMVPKAGDEITEALMDKLLLDFHTAEYVKRRLADERRISFKDLLGNEYYLEPDEILAVVEEAITDLARDISKAIISLNDKSPQAVICVGGGSHTPGLLKCLARELGISENRVRALGVEAVKGVEMTYSGLSGPEHVTSVGIGLSSDMDCLQSATVYVNDRKVTFLPIMQSTISDVLLFAGYKMRDLYGKPGMALTVEVNGKIVPIKGTFGEHASITLNGEPALLSSLVYDGDRINVVKATAGVDAKGRVRDGIGDIKPFEFFWQGERIKLLPRIYVNGTRVDLEHELSDGDVIEYNNTLTVEEALTDLGVQIPPAALVKYTVNSNPEERFVSQIEILMDNIPVTGNSVLKPEATIQIVPGRKSLRVCDVVDMPEESGISVMVNGKLLRLNVASVSIRVNGKEADVNTTISYGDAIEMSHSATASSFIFADIFRYIDFEKEPPEGRRKLIHRVNGEDAGYTTPINDGDEVEIRWE